MPLARIGDRLLFFVHIPKTGGTSIEAYLRAKGAVALHGHGEGWARTPLQHMHRDLYAELVPPGVYDHGFAVVRDPLARMISEFRMRAKPLPSKWRLSRWWRAARLHARGQPAYGFRIRRRVEILDFDGWVERTLAEARRDPFYRSNHLRPQSAFVDPAHRLFRFEDGLDPVFRWIDDVTGTSPAPGFHMRPAKPIELVCSPETERRIRDFYAEDYALLARLGDR